MKTIAQQSLKFVFTFTLILNLFSCEEDPQLPDNLAAFESAELGFEADETEITININFSRTVSEAGNIMVSLAPEGVEYGTDFTTSPAASANTITVPFVAGAAQASFIVTREPTAVLDGDESISFTINSVSGELEQGATQQLVLNFAEILALQATMNINGGGPTYPNKVFIDLSANRQTAVDRTTWDLGFSMGNDFRVILNSSVTMMARGIDKADLNEVTTADTVGFGEVMIIGANATPEALAWIDDPEGDQTKTAIAEVSATASENKVFIINRGASNPPSDPSEAIPSRGWKKVRILRNGNGYTLQHSDIGATSFQELQITKDDQFNFRYVSFETGVVSIEPRKDRWDIAWTGFTNTTALGPPGSPLIPYYFQDIVLQNRNGVETAELLIANAGSYEEFTEANLDGITYLSNQIGIGAKWRSGGGPGTAPAVRTDRFYLVKDGGGNIYKLRFTALTQDGQRGRPQIEFALLKKAE